MIYNVRTSYISSKFNYISLSYINHSSLKNLSCCMGLIDNHCQLSKIKSIYRHRIINIHDLGFQIIRPETRLSLDLASSQVINQQSEVFVVIILLSCITIYGFEN